MEKPTFVRTNKRFIKIDFNEFKYIQANGDYVILFIGKERYDVHYTLNKILEVLPKNIVRIHRSFAVNINKISSIEIEIGATKTIYVDGHPLPVSQFYYDGFNKSINIL